MQNCRFESIYKGFLLITFFLSKIIQSFILPPGIIVVLIYIFRSYKKIIIFISLILWLLSTQFIAFRLLEPLEEPYRVQNNKSFDAVALLGGGYISNAPNLSLGEESLKRFIYSLEIAKKQNIPIIFDGGEEEAKELKKTINELNSKLKINLPILNGKYKKKYGIYIQNKALTTIDNAKNIKEFFSKNGIKNPKLALVTSAYHMKRALDEFKRVSLNPTPRATDFKVSKDNYFSYYLPSAYGLNLSYHALHEYLGLFRNYLFR